MLGRAAALGAPPAAIIGHKHRHYRKRKRDHECEVPWLRPVEYNCQQILALCESEAAEAWLSIINLGEVVYIVEREQSLQAAQKTIALVDQLPLQVVDADRPRTLAAAHIKANHALSYADAFAIALARELDAQVVTGDPEFSKAEELVAVRWIHR